MGIPTLILAQTASGDDEIDFIDGTAGVVFASTYDEYMFVCTDIGPGTDGGAFKFQVNATDDAGGGYDTSLITSTFFSARHTEAGYTELAYRTGEDLAQSASFQYLVEETGNGGDESCAGILHIFSPSSTTYVKHFYSHFNSMLRGSITADSFSAGYINDTTAIDEIRFKMGTGNFDGVIQMYGIS